MKEKVIKGDVPRRKQSKAVAWKGKDKLIRGSVAEMVVAVISLSLYSPFTWKYSTMAPLHESERGEGFLGIAQDHW